MVNDQQVLFDFVGDILYKSDAGQLDLDKLEPENRKLGEALNFLAQKIAETRAFSFDLANGQLESSPSNRDNPLVGPLKDLQANLRHLTWQAHRVADGDFNQKVDFLGEFSSAFNTMTEQLKAREHLLEENAIMEKKIATQQKETLEKTMSIQANYYESIMKTNDEMRAFKHDVKNHFLSINSLISNQMYDEAKAYIDSISKTVLSTKPVIYTDNPVFDSLLSDKERIIDNKHITFTKEIDIKPQLKIEPMDFCILFGNSLDNAIEAASKVKKDPYIDLSVKCRGNAFHCTLKNNCTETPTLREDGLFKTSKADSSNHGIGLKNIQAVVNKYNGVMDVECKNNVFTLTFTLFDVVE